MYRPFNKAEFHHLTTRDILWLYRMTTVYYGSNVLRTVFSARKAMFSQTGQKFAEQLQYNASLQIDQRT